METGSHGVRRTAVAVVDARERNSALKTAAKPFSRLFLGPAYPGLS